MNLIVKTFKDYSPGKRYILKKPVQSWWPGIQDIAVGVEVSFLHLSHNHMDDLWTINFQTDEGVKIAFNASGPNDSDAEARLSEVLRATSS